MTHAPFTANADRLASGIGVYLSLAILLAIWDTAGAIADEIVRPNVLFIAVDDLRPELGCYGNEQIVSPNIDRLANGGVTFTRAYCQVAVCNPSRASMLTGLRPDTVKVWDLRVHFRDTVPDVVTLPQHFKNHGYYSVAFGKLFHNPLPDARSWNEPNHWPENASAWSKESRQRLAAYREQMRDAGKPEAAVKRMRAPATDDEDVPDSARPDGEIADQAVASLKRLSGDEQPFFLAVGFIRPHLPFTPPKKYWDLYSREEIPLAVDPHTPNEAPTVAMNTMYELRDYMDFADSLSPHSGSLPEADQRRLKHGYYASISFVDAQIGRLLDTLDELDVADNTIVVLWGDHGWKLGEHNSWCKQTNYEIDTRVPLIVRSPSRDALAVAEERTCNALVESIDIYPTLCELAGLPSPPAIHNPNAVGISLEGRSLVPLLEGDAAPWKDAAFSQFRRRENGVEYMGYAMRTDQYRFVEWRNRATAEIYAQELYDHAVDPGERESVADQPIQFALVERLTKKLREQFPLNPQPIIPGLRSTKSSVRAEIVFENQLDEPVTVYWLDFFGGRQRVARVQPRAAVKRKTFVTHPFVAESDSGAFYLAVLPKSPTSLVMFEDK
ncbi:MAG: sulfatase-like hydrolase/transferase [Planctomycetes bacterium]|nr:sulfatase-like hydrolase/transferase [Planctomycetota bacterium]